MKSSREGLSLLKKDKERVKVALKGLLNNTFTRSLWDIHNLDLATLKMQNPEAYETVKERGMREALVKSKLFAVGRWKSPNAEKDIEIVFNHRYMELLSTLSNLAKVYGKPVYRGEDAAKVFLKSLYLIAEMELKGWAGDTGEEIAKSVKEMAEEFTRINIIGKTVTMWYSKMEELLRRIRNCAFRKTN